MCFKPFKPPCQQIKGQRRLRRGKSFESTRRCRSVSWCSHLTGGERLDELLDKAINVHLPLPALPMIQMDFLQPKEFFFNSYFELCRCITHRCLSTFISDLNICTAFNKQDCMWLIVKSSSAMPVIVTYMIPS